MKIYIIFTTKPRNMKCFLSMLDGLDVYVFKGSSVLDMTSTNDHTLGFVNTHSAAPILISLCDGSLNLNELEIKSANKRLETNIKIVDSFVISISRTDIARAARSFRGTFVTEGDVIGFAHLAIHDACACVLFSFNPSFISNNCSLPFLYESVQACLVKSTAMIVCRLAEGINQDNFSMIISHPILIERLVVDMLLEEFKLRKKLKLDQLPGNKIPNREIVPYNTHEGKYLLKWAMLIPSLCVVEQILSTGYRFTNREIIKIVYSCCRYENILVMRYFLTTFKSSIPASHLNHALTLAINWNNKRGIILLIEHGAVFSDLTYESTNKLFSMCAGERNEGFRMGFVYGIVGYGHTSCCVLSFFRRFPSVTFTEFCNKMFELGCEHGRLLLLELVIDFCAKNIIVGQHGWTILRKVVLNGADKIIYLLVAKGINLTLTDDDGNNVLHYACHEGHTSMVKHLLPVIDINSRGNNGYTPVLTAAYTGKKEVFDLLVKKGADLALTAESNYTVLNCACDGGNIDIIKYVLPLYAINARCLNGQTLLTCSVYNGNIEIFDFLVCQGADITVVDDDGDSLLHLACEGDHLDMVKHILSISDISSRDKQGWTPAMLAIINGHAKVFEYLADNGADTTLVDIVGDDILSLAYRGGCTELIKKLIRSNEEPNTIAKWTELMFDVATGHFEMLEDYERSDPNLIQRDGFGDTLLHLACRGGNKQCVHHLLPCYDINVRGRYGWTPLMMAARCGHLDVFQYMLLHQADLSLVSDTGQDVLTLAQRGEHGNIVRYLHCIRSMKRNRI